MQTIKRLAFILGVVFTSPLILATWLESALLGHGCERIFGSCKEILALFPTPVGQFLRLGYYWAVCESVSPDAALLFGSMLAHRSVTLGAGVVVGAYSIVGTAEIGENVLIGPRVSLLSGKYQHGRPEEREQQQHRAGKYEKIYVGRNSWIGQGAVVMANIGENCTVSAGAVLYKDAPDNTTFMGNPARKVSFQ